MKKLFTTAVLGLLLTGGVFAQDESSSSSSSMDNDKLTSDNGQPVLPESGDYAISFNGTSMLNIFNAGTINGVSNLQNGAFRQGGAGNYVSVTGKMFTSSKSAYRGIVGLNFSSNSDKELYEDDGSTFEDKKTMSNSNIVIGGGLENRIGDGRLQGYYGGQVMIGVQGSGRSYEYERALDATGQTNVDFGDNTSSDVAVVPTGGRLLSYKDGTRFSFGLIGFAGAEYFILPKLSLGAEFQWGPVFSTKGGGSYEFEYIDGNGDVVTETSESGGTSSIGTYTAIQSVKINFHF